MSSAGRRKRPSGRRSGDSGTRGAILVAARHRFGEVGYDAASIRAIAADAGVDPALVHHFFGTKEGLFAAAMEFPVVPAVAIARVLDSERARLGDGFGPHLGEIMVRTVLEIWSSVDMRVVLLSLLRSVATNDRAVVMLREFVAGTILAVLEQVADAGLDPAERRYRAALVASQMVGLMFTRYLLELEPLTSASTGELVAAIGPTLQRYLTGELSGPVR